MRSSLNPAMQDCWEGSIKMNSASDTIFAYNVVLEAGDPHTDGGHDGWALWGDINIVRVAYLGNTFTNNKEASRCVWYAMGDTRAYFNTFLSQRARNGLPAVKTTRALLMRNLVLEEPGQRHRHLADGHTTLLDHRSRFSRSNPMPDCSPSIWFAIEQPNLADYRHLLAAKGPLAILPLAKRPKTARRRSTSDLPTGQRPRATTGTARRFSTTPSRRMSASIPVTFRTGDATDPSAGV